LKIYRRYIVLIALIVAITGWHLVLCEPFRSGIVCFPSDDECTVRVARTINPFTDVLTMRASSPAQHGATDKSTAAEFREGFITSAESAAENQLRHYARRHFDLYAMVLPYSVTVDMERATTAKVEAAEDSGEPRPPSWNESTEAIIKKQEAIAKWPEVETAERRLFGKRTAEVESLAVMGEDLQGTLVISTRCLAHACPNHSALWIVDLSTGKAAGEITSDGVMDKSGKAETVVCLGDYESAERLPSVLQEGIKDALTENPQMSISYVPQIQ
jgi:hypothetical protein